MRVLVTGVAGFIGSHVAESLLLRGDHVVGIDNFNDHYDPLRKRRNLAAVEGSSDVSHFRFVEGDIRDTSLIQKMFVENAFDAVAHLAALPGVRASLDAPALYLDVNLNGTLVLLEAARRAESLPNFVFASTSSVYGNSREIPFVESAPGDRPLAPYPASKRAGELLGHTYHHVYGLDFTAVRFFTVYGPRNRPDMMAFKVIDNIQHDTEVFLYDGGNLKRDWTFVDDIARGTVAAIDRRLGYEIINLGRGEPVLLADFVRHIEDLSGKSATLISAPMPPTDMRSTHADISKAQDLLGYQPVIGIKEGIQTFLDWYERDSSSGPA
jgi:UDP-glucuronate 4-epimerase